MRSSDQLREMALTELGLAGRQERESWLAHPCTRAFIHTIQGDVLDILESWGNGNYTTETVDGTIQLNSNAIGQYTAASSMLDWVEGIADEEMFDDNP